MHNPESDLNRAHILLDLALFLCPWSVSGVELQIALIPLAACDAEANAIDKQSINNYT